MRGVELSRSRDLVEKWGQTSCRKLKSGDRPPPAVRQITERNRVKSPNGIDFGRLKDVGDRPPRKWPCEVSKTRFIQIRSCTLDLHMIIRTMFTREIASYIDKIRKEFSVVALFGPRQSGKTTLARMLFPDYSYVNFEHESTLNAAQSDLDGFMRLNPATSTSWRSSPPSRSTKLMRRAY